MFRLLALACLVAGATALHQERISLGGCTQGYHRCDTKLYGEGDVAVTEKTYVSTQNIQCPADLVKRGEFSKDDKCCKEVWKVRFNKKAHNDAGKDVDMTCYRTSTSTGLGAKLSQFFMSASTKSCRCSANEDWSGLGIVAGIFHGILGGAKEAVQRTLQSL